MHSLNDTFSSVYEVHQLEERPSSSQDEYWFLPDNDRPRDGLLISVSAPLRKWHGIFNFGDGTFSGFFTHPDPEKLLVISRGISYIVNVNDPARYDIGPTRFAKGALAHCTNHN